MAINMEASGAPKAVRELTKRGYASIPAGLDVAVAGLSHLFAEDRAGSRCILDDSAVREVTLRLRDQLMGADLLPPSAVAIQAIAFDKTPAKNWKVTWHQDVMFPFSSVPANSGFDLPSKKDGVLYARPPREILEEMTAVRFHLDECNESNGPLRAAPGSHLHGIVPSARIADLIAQHGQVSCPVGAGDVLVLKPLLLHASSSAQVPTHRRVLHIVYHSGRPISATWHRAV